MNIDHVLITQLSFMREEFLEAGLTHRAEAITETIKLIESLQEDLDRQKDKLFNILVALEFCYPEEAVDAPTHILVDVARLITTASKYGAMVRSALKRKQGDFDA